MAKKSKPQQPQQLSPERFIRERGRSIPVEKCYLDLVSIKELGEGNYTWGRILLRTEVRRICSGCD